jgi:hypothetical protein
MVVAALTIHVIHLICSDFPQKAEEMMAGRWEECLDRGGPQA